MRIEKSGKSNRKNGPIAVVCLLLLLVFHFSAVPAQAEQAGVKLTIMHLNDTHGHILPFIDKSVSPTEPVSGGAYFARMIEKEKARNPKGALLLSAGDMFQGTPISNLFHGRPVIELMNYLKFDAMTLGNHEFDWGQDVLREMIASSRFPVLGANITDENGKYFNRVKPSILIKRKGVSIGIIGVTTPEAEYTSKPGNLAGLKISAPEKVIPPLIKDLRAKGASLIIVLSHIGLDEDRRLASAVPGIDIIVGGHSHTVVPNPVNENGTIIVQAGSYGVYLGVLDIYYDPATKKILDYTHKDELKLVSAGPQAQKDPVAASLIGKYENRVKAEFSKVVGTASVDLVRQARDESNIGDFITDAMRQDTGAQIAFLNSGAIRSDILRGPITRESLYTAMPFDSILVSMDLTGEQIGKILEQAAASEKTLQVSGLKVEYDTSKPEGSKVVSATVDSKPLEPGSTYRVTVQDFLAAGGDMYKTFLDGGNTVIGSDLRDAVANYARSHSPVDTAIQGRIVFK